MQKKTYSKPCLQVHEMDARSSILLTLSKGTEADSTPAMSNESWQEDIWSKVQ